MGVDTNFDNLIRSKFDLIHPIFEEKTIKIKIRLVLLPR
jgi:hypothetical protein